MRTISLIKSIYLILKKFKLHQVYFFQKKNFLKKLLIKYFLNSLGLRRQIKGVNKLDYESEEVTNKIHSCSFCESIYEVFL